MSLQGCFWVFVMAVKGNTRISLESHPVHLIGGMEDIHILLEFRI